ncbi:MAG: 3-hydroxyacyl-CoA dehydrogenase family protein [Halobacteriota archaeon]
MNVCVLGAGTMGRSIAYVAALAGNDVVIRDIDDAVLADAIESIESLVDGGVDRGRFDRETATAVLERLSTATDLQGALESADLVIEAVPEDLDLKRDVLSEAAGIAETATIATNTSSLSVTAVASAIDDPTRVVGLHFFNPAYAMDLVEVVVAEQTAESTRSFAESFVEELGKTPIVVSDTPGFATSRLGVTLGVEAIRMVETGVGSPRDIDEAMKLGYGHPMGPLELTDVVGLDVRLDILEHLRSELGERFRPPSLLRRKVRAGALGRKSGEGFYVWEDGEIVGVSGADRR